MRADRRAHTTFPTLDVDGLPPFYEDVLGFTPRAVLDGAVVYRAAWFKDPHGNLLAVLQASEPV
jgi:hypothetical protein